MNEMVVDDYEMNVNDLVVLVDPSKPFIEIKLPNVGECTGRFYSISNFCTSGNTIHIVDRGDSHEFSSPSDLNMGDALIYYSNGVQWLLVFANSVV